MGRFLPKDRVFFSKKTGYYAIYEFPSESLKCNVTIGGNF